MADHSPAARAIVAAFNDRYELCGPFDDNWQEVCLAAALRAAADQDAPLWMGDSYQDGWCAALESLVAIAAELEKSHD